MMLNIGRQKGGQGKYDLGNKIEFEGWKSEENIFLCVCGIATFCKNIKNNYWWRWIYIFGGSYVLFDLFAIAIELKVWNDLLLFMFDVNSQYWNIVWGFFIILGAFVFCLGMKLLKQRKEQI